jgi:hypothetical protein
MLTYAPDKKPGLALYEALSRAVRDHILKSTTKPSGTG